MNIKHYKAIWLFLLIIAGPASAFHIVGGDISMTHLGRPGYFRVTLNQYWDEIGIAKNASSVVYETSVTIYVYSLGTRQLIDKFVLKQADKQLLTYRNQACAQTTGQRTSEVHYTANLQFTPGRYTESQGYYVVWERCCRNGAIDNIETPSMVGQVFYLEFPAMQQNGSDFTNSAPAFRLPNGEYICINKPFKFDFGATDKDGDELRYQLVTPWAGYTSSMGRNLADGLPHDSYPTVSWLPGFSDQVMIPGPSPLKIDAKTGQLSVTANQQGLFVFAVELTEYRNGRAIGKVRREFQLFVADCATNVPPPAVIAYNGQPVKSVEFCAGNPVQLTVQTNPNWAYQWQLEGSNLTGATNATLVVQDAGNYTVVKSLAQTCSRDTSSESVQVVKRTPAVVKITPNPSLTICAGTSTALQAKPANGTVRWSFNQQPAPNLATTALITVGQAGLYTVDYKETGNPCPGRDSVTVVINSLPTAVITGKPAVLCGNESTQLSASAVTGSRYSWTRDGASQPLTSPSITASQTDTYHVVITDINGCSATTAFTLKQTPKPTVRFDSLAPVCSAQGAPVALSAQPPGGLFSGTGVSGNAFDPNRTGAGRFAIVYTYTDANGCQGQQRRLADVQEAIGLTVPDSLLLIAGDSIILPATVKAAISSVDWSPPAGLNSTVVLKPTTGTRETAVYTVQVKTPLGCSADARVKVRVVQRLLLPTAFTPNADGKNDSWEIRGIDTFSNVEVFIYDRWGSVIYHSLGYDQPWDGTYQGQRVEPGDYVYRVLTNVESVRYAGHVLVLY